MDNAIYFNILVKESEEGYPAHCLDLDLVTTAPTIEQVTEDIADVIACQVDYAFTYDNLDNLYHPAPPAVWDEFFKCQPIPSGHSQQVG
ncbi:MAG: hypothetical protein HY879_27095 [Deltaproteobacteria bacterium]|nr:hypothetical protein [Deltaproteobacteria bacterium]